MKPIIKIQNVSKQYRLGLIGTGTLSNDLKRWYYNIRGKEDPFLKIGEVNDRAHKGDSNYVWALKDINLDIKPGEVVGIIGKNGAGKSTLLKILSKVTGPTTGSIQFDGRIGSLLEVGTGFHPELTGRENVFLNGAILGMTKKEIRSKIDEIIDFSGCERYIDTPVKRYSSGMTVRLGFAVAAHLEPEILVVDEVLAVGDAEFQKKAIGKMQDVSRNDGRTVLFVSHNMNAVKRLCTRGVVVEKGSIGFDGETDEAIDYYLNENESFDTSIITSNISHCDPRLRIENIRINGNNESYVRLDSGVSVLELDVEGEVAEEMVLTVEIQIYDTNNNRLLFFSPGHLYGEIKKYPKGRFSIHESIQLPENITAGMFWIDLSLTHPNVSRALKAPHCCQLETKGLITQSGYFEYNQRGLLFLERKK